MKERFARTGFLERLAHDLRGAAATSGTALDELHTSTSSLDSQRYLAIARRGMRRILRITESLSDAAELERGPIELVRERCSLHDLVAEATERARSLENRRAVEVTMNSSPDLMVEVDRERLVRVVFELVSNAIRAAEKEVVVSAHASERETTVSIVDDGAGCPPLAGRFAPTEARRGLGLGLAMAVDVMAAHGGRLAVDREGDRTRVALTLVRP